MKSYTKNASKLRTFVTRLNDAPSLLVLAAASIVSFGLMGGANSILNASYSKSQFPVPYAQGQTAFDGDLLKSYYQHMLDLGTFDVYVQTQYVDFLFIATVILLGFFAWTLLARLHPVDSFFRKAGLWLAFALPLAGIADAIENLISFVLLANPLQFPNWMAMVYSAVAVIKFGFWTIGLGWFAISVVALAVGFVWRLIGKKK